MENESRNLWKEVTAGLRLNDIDKATVAKTVLEQKQRDEAKKRKERGMIWETKVRKIYFLFRKKKKEEQTTTRPVACKNTKFRKLIISRKQLF